MDELNWRPKGWGRVLLREVKKVPDAKLLEGDLPKALLMFAEAGADAMYKGMVKDGWVKLGKETSRLLQGDCNG